tara:strand:- start:654 stop:1763 length:1110 start_codon:yes stop_codon:yes gene_type:complete
MTRARELAELGSVYDSGALSNRNIIINGAMQVAQRGTSFTGPSSGAYTLDRWMSGLQTTSGDGDFSQATDVPTATQSGTAFKNSLKFQVTTADASIAATDRTYLVQKIEGQNLVSAGFGQSGTRYMTLSFWHKHTKTGTHSLAINNGARDRSYPMEYTQTTTNTWEKAELTFPVDTSGTWPTDNTAGMWIFWGIAFGSNYAGTANAWAGAQAYGTSSQVNNLDSTSNAMLFTGVQLEVGTEATPFEHRTFSDELARCQRYFCRTYGYGTATGASDTSAGCISTGINAAYTYASAGNFNFPVEMRASPTVTLYSTYNANTTGKVTADATDGTGVAIFTTTSRTFLTRSNDSTGTGANVFMRAHAIADAEL